MLFTGRPLRELGLLVFIFKSPDVMDWSKKIEYFTSRYWISFENTFLKQNSDAPSGTRLAARVHFENILFILDRKYKKYYCKGKPGKNFDQILLGICVLFIIKFFTNWVRVVRTYSSRSWSGINIVILKNFYSFWLKIQGIFKEKVSRSLIKFHSVFAWYKPSIFFRNWLRVVRIDSSRGWSALSMLIFHSFYSFWSENTRNIQEQTAKNFDQILLGICGLYRIKCFSNWVRVVRIYSY